MLRAPSGSKIRGSQIWEQIGGLLRYSVNKFDWVFGLPKTMNSRSFNLVVDFGCGSIPRNPFSSKKVIGADLSKNSPFVTSPSLEYRQIIPGKKIPFDDNSLDAITGFDVIEHLPRQGSGVEGNVFIETMNEFYRVLKPGGILLAVTPCYPSAAAFTDPTHVNIITPGTHKYFSDDNFAKSLSYGFIGEFKTLSAGWYPWAASWLLHTTMPVSGSSGSEHEPSAISYKARFSQIVKRAREFVIFGLFARGRTHYLWVLEKV